MAQSKIEWTEFTWNPVTGCNKISPGCKNFNGIKQEKKMDTTEKLKKLWKQGITKDAWGYDILEADLDGILKLTSEWIDKNFIPVEEKMKYNEAIEKLKQGWQLRYITDETGTSTNIGDEDWNDVIELHHNTVKKILNTYDHIFRTYAIEGSTETGWIQINFSKQKI